MNKRSSTCYLVIKRFYFLCLVFFIFGFFLFCPTCNAATYYIDAAGGNDTNSGLSTSSPWLTIGKANSTLQPGDTVYLRAGTYRQTIRPANSGTQGNYITYIRYNNEEAIITGVYYGADLRDRHYIKIDGLKILNTNSSWITMRNPSQGSSNNIIQNCHMEEAYSWAGVWLNGDNVYHNKILNNTLIGYAIPDDVIYLRDGAHHNVVEGNDVRYGAHNGINVHTYSHYNVVRNNRVWNPWHTSISSYISSNHTLIEGNTILDSGEDAANIPAPPGCTVGDTSCDSRQPTRDRVGDYRRYHNGIQLGSSDCIVRNNVLVNNGNFGMGTYAPSFAWNNRVYNNSLVKNVDGWYSESGNDVHGNILKNNIFFKNYEYEIRNYISTTPGEYENYFINNNLPSYSASGRLLYFRPFGGNGTLDHFQGNYPQFFVGNIEVDPSFNDINGTNGSDNSNFSPESLHLSGDSPMINAGAFLTKTASSGSGTTIPLNDSRYFYDGWGIPGEQGDLIQLEGQTQTARITNVDYDNNRITVDRSLTWSAGQGVSLPYSGSAPDIGAFEYGAAILYGDVSENGAISAYDASLTAQHAVGITTLTPEQQTKADVSGEGSVSAFDASWIARKVVDPSVVFPVEE